MVKGSRLEFDDELFEEKPRAGFSFQRGRVDNSLAISVVAAIGLVVLLALTTDNENWCAFLLIGLIFFASELFALPLRGGGRISLALLPVTMAIMISGPLSAALVALFGVPVFAMERGEYGLRRVVFNASQLLVASGAAAFVFHHTGGALLQPSLENGTKLVFPWALATLVFFVVNTLLVIPVLAPENEPLTRSWARRLMPAFPGYVLYAGIGFFAAILYLRLEFPAVVLLVAPLIAIRVVFTRYEKMRDVCDNTSLAVMEAVESPGSLTEGHSVGVAEMAVAIAEEMNFAEEDIHYLRQAALLHDIGKLSLDRSILEKPGTLTPEEYEHVKDHPLVAGRIAAKEASFARVAPSITHHHETFDGSGYVDGLAGETIPIGARILAVADSYDAMQRKMSFREPLNAYDAASEVVKVKGIQFDPEVVDAFINVVTHRGVWSGSKKEKLAMPSKPSAREGGVVEPLQPTLEEAGLREEPAKEAEDMGKTPADGIKYTDVRGDIEQDISEWKRLDSEKRKERERPKRGRWSSSRKKDRKKE
jgi:putative nucleotidyltransferase with HDIG domain